MNIFVRNITIHSVSDASIINIGAAGNFVTKTPSPSDGTGQGGGQIGTSPAGGPTGGPVGIGTGSAGGPVGATVP
jgi:hypothetical protein